MPNTLAVIRNIPHPGIRSATTMREPITLGEYSNEDPITLNPLGRNILMTGVTDSGKTVLAHNYLDAILAKTDNLTWVAGTYPMNPLVLPWLRPWLTGHTRRPILDRVAGTDPHEVLTLLDDFRHLATVQSRRALYSTCRDVTPDMPAISLVIDNAAHLLRDRDLRIHTRDGKEMTAAALLRDIFELSRLASMNVFLSTWGDLGGGCAPEASELARHASVRIAGRTNTIGDSNRILDDTKDALRATRLRDHTLLLDIAHETYGAREGKAYNLSHPDRISGHADAYTDRKPTMPADLADELGDSYTNRWDPNRQPDLVAACKSLGITYPDSNVN